MKCTTNYDYTAKHQRETIKNAIAEFKGYYTENDLVRLFTEEYNIDLIQGDVIQCDVSVFPADFLVTKITFCVDIVIRDCIGFSVMHFYVDRNENGTFSHHRDPLVDYYERYHKVR